MGVSVCPAAVVEAPIDKVWSLLEDPKNYARWSDLHVTSITPEGKAASGQLVHGWAEGFGRHWQVSMRIGSIDHANHQLEITTMLPLGMTVKNHISCRALSEGSCRVQFG